jgi:hypothetical protein
MVARKMVVFEGVRYQLDKETGYYAACYTKDRKGRTLHRSVWEHNKGPIPKGFVIHHKDHNKLNNKISNLELLSDSDHKKQHWVEDKEIMLAATRQNIQKANLASKEWHGSPEGLEWHGQHAKAVYAKHVPTPAVCAWCHKTFLDKCLRGDTRFCSNSCRIKNRYASGVDNQTRLCIECGKPFTVNKYEKKVNCTRSCAMRARHRKNRA